MAHSPPAQQAVLEVGGLAQLVERLLCKQDVSGSSPLTSIQQILENTRRDQTLCVDDRSMARAMIEQDSSLVSFPGVEPG